MKTTISIILVAMSAYQAAACETCALYSPPSQRFLLNQDRKQPYKLNWFTRYSTLDTRLTGTRETDAHGEEIKSYINQLSLEYKVAPRLHAQLSLPILSRDFKAREGEHLQPDDESGPGDLSVIGKYILRETTLKEGHLTVTLVGGLKTPTGNTDRIGAHHAHDDEAAHETASEPDSGEADHHTEEAGDAGEHAHGTSAISEHDVTLGSGSWDPFGGVQAEYSRNNWSLDGMVQYYWRSEGDYDYTFADDLYISAHIGRILIRKNNVALGLRAGVLGEFRDADEQGGVAIEHTALDSWYVDLTATLAAGSFIGEAGVDLPLEQESGAATLVPDARFRLSAGIFF
jgi:hypothetical protein